MEPAQDLGRLLLRLTVAGLILFHGTDKILHGIGWMHGSLSAVHLPFVIAYGVYAGEVIAPLLVILGIFTRVASLVIAFNMVMALLLDAGKFALTINQSGGWGIETEAFYLLTALVVFLMGPGRYRLGTKAGFWQ